MRIGWIKTKNNVSSILITVPAFPKHWWGLLCLPWSTELSYPALKQPHWSVWGKPTGIFTGAVSGSHFPSLSLGLLFPKCRWWIHLIIFILKTQWNNAYKVLSVIFLNHFSLYTLLCVFFSILEILRHKDVFQISSHHEAFSNHPQSSVKSIR